MKGEDLRIYFTQTEETTGKFVPHEEHTHLWEFGDFSGWTSTIREVSLKREGTQGIDFPKGFLSDIEEEVYALSQVKLRPLEDAKSIQEIISEGESTVVEFKSTLSRPLAGGERKEVEHASIKTICAFLNSKGGTLLIGVTDRREIVGIEADIYRDTDALLRKLDDLIKTHLGNFVRDHLSIRIENVGDAEVLRISCNPSDRPIYLRRPGQNEPVFWIRGAASSVRLQVDEVSHYIESHFSSR